MINNTALGNKVNSVLDIITLRFDALSSEISHLRNNVATLDARVLALELRDPITPLLHPLMKLLPEFTDRDRCIANIPESTSLNSSSKFADNENYLRSLISKIFRHGKPSSSTSYPLKFIFNCQSMDADVLSAFRSAYISSLNILPGVKLNKTPLERNRLCSSHQKLDRRILNGESDLTISY